MARQSISQPDIASTLFEGFVKQYEKDLARKHDYMFEIPNVLKNLCKVIFIHDQSKTVHHVSLPKHTIFMEDVDKCLDYLNVVIRTETRGYFQRVDEVTEMELRQPGFRSCILAFFYLQGLWSATLFGPGTFKNRNGTMAKNVTMIGFYDVRVVVLDGKLKAQVGYVAQHNKRQRDVVRFTMPVDANVEEGIYEHSLLLVPKVDVTSRREYGDGQNTTVIQFRYMHNEEGFKAVGMMAMTSSDGCGPMVRKKFVLDKPFQIQVYYKSEKMIRVRVDNL